MEPIKNGRLLFNFPDVTQMQAENIRETFLNTPEDDRNHIFFFGISKFSITDLDNQIAYEWDGEHLHIRRTPQGRINIKSMLMQVAEHEKKLNEIEADLPLMKRLIPDYLKIAKIEAGNP